MGVWHLHRNEAEGGLLLAPTFPLIIKLQPGTSLVVQWLRICLPMQGTWVRFLVLEDSTCCGVTKLMSHPWWLRWQRIYLQCRRPRFNPWVGKIPQREKWQPTEVFLPGEVKRNPAGYSPWGQKELDMTKQLTLKKTLQLLSIALVWLSKVFRISTESCMLRSRLSLQFHQNYVFYCILTRSFVKIHLNLEYRGKSRAVLQMNKHALKFQANSNPLRIYLCGSRIIR